jgi:predicted GIY-YIG superfamily endonuclease
MEIVSKKPYSIEDLLKIKGMGVEKAKQFGDDIIGMVKGTHLSMNKPVVVKHDTRASSSSSSSSSSRRNLRSVKSLDATKSVKPVKVKPNDIKRKVAKVNPIVMGNSSTAPVQHVTVSNTLATTVTTHSIPRVVMKHQQPNVSRSSNTGDNFEVYILELQGGKVYVGKSSNTDKRIAQHTLGTGSAFTRTYHPTGVMLPRLGKVSGDGEAAERDETLRYMYLRGIDNVRGWRYTQVYMPKEDRKDAERNIREVMDLCRRCGSPRHFVSHCKEHHDRHGHKI